MAQYESNVKHVPYSQEQVYNKLSDLNHLSSLRDRMDLIKEKLDGKLEDMSFDTDSLTLKVQGISLTLHNPTAYDAVVTIFAEDATQALQPLGDNAFTDWKQKVAVKAGKTKTVKL